MYHNGEWGTVCHDGWDMNDAQVACRQLGFGSPIAFNHFPHYGEGSGQIWLDNVECVGTELTIEDCSHNGWACHNCPHYKDIGVHCSLPDGNNCSFVFACVYMCTIITGAVDLVNGPTKYEGRVKVYHSGEWGTVCDDGWDLNDAQVVCRQLDFGPAIAIKTGAFYGRGSSQIWLDNVDCIGTESAIKDCSHNTWGYHNCLHSQDAAVQCSASDG